MIFTDILVIVGLSVFLLAWWARKLPFRPTVLTISALLALAGGCTGVLDDRWQAGPGALAAGFLLLLLLIDRLRGARWRPLLHAAAGVAFAGLAALAVVPLVLFPIHALPAPSGEHPVGVRTFEVTDDSRTGIFHAGPTEGRRLLVRVWYPASATAGFKRLPYFTVAQAIGHAPSGPIHRPSYFGHLKHVRTNAYVDAPLATGLGRLPVIFYSHGYSSFLGQNTMVMEDLASHGYVVFALQHTYDSSTTVFPNGDVVPTDPALVTEAKIAPSPEARRAEQAAIAGPTLDARLDGHLRRREQSVANNVRAARSGVVWLADRLFLHDLLQRGGAPSSIAPIVAASDLTRVGEMGMSFGGGISGSVCMVDPRCAAGVNLDGDDLAFHAFGADMPKPFLMLYSDMAGVFGDVGVQTDTPPDHGYNEFSYERFAAAGTRPDIYRMQIKDARHMGLTDLRLFIRRPIRDRRLGITPTPVLIGIQTDLVRGFFDHHLRGLDNGFPAAPREAYADWLEPISNAAVRDWWMRKTPAEQAAITARIAKAKAPGS